METFDTPEDRLAFITGAATVTKRELTADEGIGEKAPFTIFAWRDGSVIVIAQLSRKFDADQQARFEAVMTTAFYLRTHAGADAFTLATEGYRTTTEVPDKSLNERFAAGDQDVQEILIVVQCESRNSFMATRSFKYELGRKVDFGEVRAEELQGGAAYPDAFRDLVFSVEPSDLGIDTEALIPLGVHLYIDS